MKVMMMVNLAPEPSLGPVFDADAQGLARLLPRREWWPLLPVLVLGAPAIGATMLVASVARRMR